MRSAWELATHLVQIPAIDLLILQEGTESEVQAPIKAWLLEIVTHTHHHRAMLHTYLKLMGRPVDQSYIYC